MNPPPAGANPLPAGTSPQITGVNLEIRPYQPGDREALFKIGAETAFFGAPIEVYMEDRGAFLDSFYAYYTDYEPEHAWVACADSQVVGFLTGCTDTKRQEQITKSKLVPGVIWNVLRRRYKLGPKVWRYTCEIIGAGLRGEFPPADVERFPAHLHINLADGFRGLGLGRRLMQTYLAQLQELGVPGVHLHTTSLNEAACHLYEACGFCIWAARPTRMWRYLVDRPVENRCYAREILVR
ncbi:MAG: GNAT family N-acetyltransferase [Anaerolineaceae bacterium]